MLLGWLLLMGLVALRPLGSGGAAGGSGAPFQPQWRACSPPGLVQGSRSLEGGGRSRQVGLNLGLAFSPSPCRSSRWDEGCRGWSTG